MLEPRGDKKVLCAGLICLDILSVMDHYPVEDTDNRIKRQIWQKGGNCANSAAVVAQLDEQAEFFGTLATGRAADMVLDEMREFGVEVDHVVMHDGCDSPSSSIIINTSTGSRTIIHTDKDLPELTFSQFQQLDLNQYKWIHFEGRNMAEVSQMVNAVQEYNHSRSMEDKINISGECEKAKYKPEYFTSTVDVLFIAKEFAQHHGFSSAHAAVDGFHRRAKKGATVVCAWGEAGADVMGPDGVHHHSDAFSPGQVVDTLGAGDTFNGAIIAAMCRSLPLDEVLKFGCRVAGKKCGQFGYRGLGE
ncbi:ketohexokinase-like isoform X1 [Branchiostoma lanceolatum]|uniref:Ketohexokinase n=2 Tax=Branchiostoma lanceolatum TaxID=7740 RepID=A0A8J9ZEP8_BRALA|nr:KHK [Branchiostoma lanceolatum]